MQEATAETKALVEALRPVAKVDFEGLKRFSGNPFAEETDAPASAIS